MNVIVEGGAVPALVKHLQAPPVGESDCQSSKPYEHEVEKGSAFALGLLAVKVVECYSSSSLLSSPISPPCAACSIPLLQSPPEVIAAAMDAGISVFLFFVC